MDQGNHITWYTRSIEYVDLNRAAWYPVPPFAPCQSQSEPDSMSESHLLVTFIAAGIVRSYHSALVSAMFIGAGIVRDLVGDLVRDLVRDHVRAVLVRAKHVKATLVRATLVRANLLSHMTYSLIHKMKDSLDLRFNHGGSDGEIGSTKSPSELNRAGIHLSQPGLSDHVRAHLSEPCLSEPGLSGIMPGTMSKRHLSGPHLSGPHLSELELSETMSECTFTAGIIWDYVRATLIRPWLSQTISEPHLSQ